MAFAAVPRYDCSMLQHENLLTTLDQFNTAVFLKDLNGRYLSMNSKGIQFMKEHHGRVLGKTTYDLFDFKTATQMVESDHRLLQSKGVEAFHSDAKSLITGKRISIFTAKTAIRSPSGNPLGTVAIALMNYQNADMFSDVCRLLPHFVASKRHHLIHELLELQTIMEFSKTHRRLH